MFILKNSDSAPSFAIKGLFSELARPLVATILATAMTIVALPNKAYTAGAQGTKDGGGGGYVAKINDQYLLLDFIEGGVDDAPVNPTTPMNQKIHEVIKNYIGGPRPEVVELLANKFSHMYKTDPFMTYFMLRGVQRLDWKFVSAPIIRLDDIGESNIDVSQLDLFQAAIRKDSAITVSKKIFMEMPVEHAAGLLMHEIVYAFTSPDIFEQVLPDGRRDYVAITKSYHARLVVAGFYSKRVLTAKTYNEVASLSLQNKTNAVQVFVPMLFGTNSDNKFLETTVTTGTQKVIEIKFFTSLGDSGWSWEKLNYSDLEDTKKVTDICNLVYPHYQPHNGKTYFLEYRSLEVVAFNFILNPLPELISSVIPESRSAIKADRDYFRFMEAYDVLDTTPERKVVSSPKECIHYLKSLTPIANPAELL